MPGRTGHRPLLRPLSTGDAGHGPDNRPFARICMVHPGTLPVTVYRPLAAVLAPRVAIDVLEMNGLPAYRSALLTDRTDVTVGLLARQLAAHVDHTKYRLYAGWSFGGLVALELAVRPAVPARPREVVLLDSVASWRDSSLSVQAVRPHQALTWFCMLLGARTGRAFPVEEDRLRGTLPDALAYVLDRAIEQSVLPAGTTVGWLRELFLGYARGIRRNGRMAEGFRPSAVPERLLLLKPERSLFPGGSSLGWESVAGPALKVFPCPGDHYSLLTDPAAVAHTASVLGSAVSSPDWQGQIP